MDWSFGQTTRSSVKEPRASLPLPDQRPIPRSGLVHRLFLLGWGEHARCGAAEATPLFRPFSRRSGRIPAEPYPPLKCPPRHSREVTQVRSFKVTHRKIRICCVYTCGVGLSTSSAPKARSGNMVVSIAIRHNTATCPRARASDFAPEAPHQGSGPAELGGSILASKPGSLLASAEAHRV